MTNQQEPAIEAVFEMATGHMIRLFLLLALALHSNFAGATSNSVSSSQLPNLETEPLTRIAFGSCINQTIEQVRAFNELLFSYLTLRERCYVSLRS